MLNILLILNKPSISHKLSVAVIPGQDIHALFQCGYIQIDIRLAAGLRKLLPLTQRIVNSKCKNLLGILDANLIDRWIRKKAQGLNVQVSGGYDSSTITISDLQIIELQDDLTDWDQRKNKQKRTSRKHSPR